MTKLPNRSGIQIKRKLTHYLLDPNHRLGEPKSGFFFSHGFRLENAPQLEDALRHHAYHCDVVKLKDNWIRVLYTLEGALQTPKRAAADSEIRLVPGFSYAELAIFFCDCLPRREGEQVVINELDAVVLTIDLPEED
jgi:hypothetical protein